MNTPYLGDLFQPPAQGNEHKKHGGRVEESDGVDRCLLHHGNHQDDQRVGEGYGGCQDDEDIHVSCFVLQGFIGLDVEVSPTDELWKEMNRLSKLICSQYIEYAGIYQIQH